MGHYRKVRTEINLELQYLAPNDVDPIEVLAENRDLLHALHMAGFKIKKIDERGRTEWVDKD
jgi:hypothetical protein